MPVKGSRGSEEDDPPPDVNGRSGPLCTAVSALGRSPHGYGIDYAFFFVHVLIHCGDLNSVIM